MRIHSTSPELTSYSTLGQQALELLKQSEERFKTLVANIPGAVYRCADDSAWTMDFLSEVIEDISGYPASDFINNQVRSFTNIIHPGDRAKIAQAIQQSIAHRQPYVIEYRIVRSDGSIGWVYDKGQGVFEENTKGQPQADYPCWRDGVILDITERKQAQAELQYTKGFLNSVIENLPVGVFIKDANGLQIMYWNKACEDLLGYSKQEVLGKNDYDFLPKQQARYLRAKDRQVLTGGQLVDIPEAPVITPHRGKRLLHTKKVPLLDQSGIPQYLLGICEDITERKQALEALRESEAHYRRIVETALEGVWMFDADNKTTFANSRMAQMLGYSVEELLGRSLFEFIDADSQALIHTYIERRRQGIRERLDFKFRRKDGSDLWAIVSATPIFDANGQFAGVLRMVTDITERKQAEEALRESERKFRAIFDAMFQFIGLLKPDGTLLEANQTALDFGGLQLKDIAGRPFWEARWWCISRQTQERLQAAIAQAAAGEFVRYEVDILGAGEQVVTIDFSIKPVKDETGKVVLLIPEGRDISDRKLAEEALLKSEAREREKAAQLEMTLRELQSTQTQLVQNEKMISLGQLVAGVAHEINNPTSFIYGNIGPAREYASNLLRLVQLYNKYYPQPVPEIQDEIHAIDLDFLSEDFPKLLKSMKDGANRIREIVLSLRNFSRLDEAEIKQVNIHEGIDSTLLILQHRLKEGPCYPEIQVIKHYTQLPLVECYPGPLNQVFMNVLSNAIDAVETQPAPRIITIRTEMKTGESGRGGEGERERNPQLQSRIKQQDSPPCQVVVIRIVDNGCGIPEDVRQRIFDPFFTTKPVGVGTGLGLSISHSIIVDKHGGQLYCISVPGHGAEFVIELPVRQKQ